MKKLINNKLRAKFPFGIDNIVLFDNTEDFLKMNHLSEEILYLIRGNHIINKVKAQKNYTKKFLHDSLIQYYNKQIEKHPEVIFFKLRKAVLFFQYGDYKQGITYLKITKELHPQHYAPKIYLAFEYIQQPNLKKTFDALDIKDSNKELKAIHDVFPEVKEMMAIEYLKFLFVLIGIYNEKAKNYHAINEEEKKNNCVRQVYEFMSTMIFIDAKNPITIQTQNYLQTNPNYKF